MKLNTIIIVLFMMCFCIQPKAQDISMIQQVSTNSIDSLLSHLPIYQIIDVRTEKEYKIQHVKGSINQDVNHKKFLKKFKKQFPSKEITYIVYCRTGKRSMNAANQLVKGGYKIINLSEGILSIPAQFLWQDPSYKIQNISDSTKSTVNQ